MMSWRDKGRNGLSVGISGVATEDDVVLPLGPGEWEEALGLPLCVVCYNSDQMETLERERAWKDEEFDFILQSLRTVLLKRKLIYLHGNMECLLIIAKDGASLIYTSHSTSNPLQALIHSSLGIQSLLKKQPLKPNVIDRDKVLVPSNWDSWGKIRVLRDGFNVEGLNRGWSSDIHEAGQSIGGEELELEQSLIDASSALRVYEETIPDPAAGSYSSSRTETDANELEVKSQDPQTFLASQLEVLDRVKHSMESNNRPGRRDAPNRITTMLENGTGDGNIATDEGRVSDHIGPVQFNMGGIQVDADDMLQRLKVRLDAYCSSLKSAN